MRGLETVPLEVREPSSTVWVPIICALTWIRFEHSVDIDELLAGTGSSLGLSEEELKAQLQDTWRALADFGSTGRVTIRGRRDGEREERELDRNDLRNCRWLTWGPTPRRPADGPNLSGASGTAGPYDVRVRRYEDTFEDQFEGFRVNAVNFEDLVVSRHELMNLYPLPTIPARKLRSSVAAFEQALEWLEHQFRTLPRKSHTRPFFIGRLRTEFGLSLKRAEDVWSQARRKFPDWTGPGCPRKIPPAENPP